jgi:hypothetical protein
MAQTSARKNSQARRKTTGRSNGSGRSAASTRGSNSTRNRQQRNGRSSAKSRSSGAARSSSQTTNRSRRQPRRSGATAGTDSVKQFASKGKDAVAEGVQSSGKTISTVAGKVKGPALAAGGAALAGLAGGIAVQSKRHSGRKILGMRVGNGVGKAGKNLADAGQSVGRFSENLGEFATEMRKTREAIDNRAKHRSPVEVLLQALTARR